MDLCGHATLAAAHVIFNHCCDKDKENKVIELESRLSGTIVVERMGYDKYEMTLPSRRPQVKRFNIKGR
jgi:predicted PhzF superfamily epimerase YddE/YHI9